MPRKKNEGSAIAAPWSVKGVTHETRECVRRAARKANLSIGDYVDKRLREVATMDLTGEVNLPAKRLEDQLAQLKEKLDTVAEQTKPHRGFFRRLFS